MDLNELTSLKKSVISVLLILATCDHGPLSLKRMFIESNVITQHLIDLNIRNPNSVVKKKNRRRKTEDFSGICRGRGPREDKRD